MIADIGTKALTSTRIETLKSMMGMGKKRKEEEVGKEANLPAEKQVASTEQAIAAVRLITLVAMMSVAKGEKQEEEEYGKFQCVSLDGRGVYRDGHRRHRHCSGCLEGRSKDETGRDRRASIPEVPKSPQQPRKRLRDAAGQGAHSR